MRTPLLIAREVDRLLRYPRGRTAKLARTGKIPHIKLPDGEIRFDPNEIEKLLTTTAQPAEVSHVTR